LNAIAHRLSRIVHRLSRIAHRLSRIVHGSSAAGQLGICKEEGCSKG